MAAVVNSVASRCLFFTRAFHISNFAVYIETKEDEPEYIFLPRDRGHSKDHG